MNKWVCAFFLFLGIMFLELARMIDSSFYAEYMVTMMKKIWDATK